MKKGVFPLYTILVIGCLACLQADENLNLLGLTAYISGTQVNSVNKNTNVIIVAPGAPEIISCYKMDKPAAYFLNTASLGNCCTVAVDHVSAAP